MTQGAVIKTCLCDCRALPLRARWVRFLAWGVLAPAVLLALPLDISERATFVGSSTLWAQSEPETPQLPAPNKDGEGADEATELDRLLAGLKADNQELAEQRTATDGPAARAEEARHESDRLVAERNQLQQRFQHVRDVGDLTDAIGMLLQRYAEQLPDIDYHRNRIRQRRTQVAEVRRELLELQVQASDLRDISGQVSKLLTNYALTLDDEHRAVIEPQLSDVLRQRRTLIEPLIRDYQDLLDALVLQLGRNEEELITQTLQFREYINERILWIPSMLVVGRSDGPDAWQTVRQLTSLSTWRHVDEILIADAKRQPMPYFGLLLVAIAILVSRRRMRRRLQRMGQLMFEGAEPSIAPLLESVFVTFVLAVQWSLLLWILGWRCRVALDGSTLTHAVGVGLQAAAAAVFNIELFRQIFRKRGLAEAHFGVAPELTRIWRRDLWVMLVVGLVGVFVVVTVRQFEANAPRPSLARLLFIAAMLVLAVVGNRVLRRSYGLIPAANIDEPRSWLSLMRNLARPLAVIMPLVLAGVAALGYIYAAERLFIRLQLTLWFIEALLLFGALARRWVELLKSPQPSAVTAARDAQSRRVFSSIGALLLAVGCYWIWVDVLPALRVLDQWQLWSYTEPVATTAASTAAAKAAPGEATPALPLTALTVGDLVLAGIVIVMTNIAARNLPGLLELIWFQRLPLDAGAKYALTSLSQYLIILIGGVWLFRVLGVGWSNVQWLIAAVSVGLGFGLQEIFANFVSGLIVLFERPIRVGDVVTIGGVSGTVTRIRARATSITDWDRKELIVPNKEFITGQLINWTLSDSILRVVIKVGVSYGADTAKAVKVLLDVASANPYLMKNPAPQAIFTDFAANAMEFEVRAFVSGPDKIGPAKHTLHMEIERTLREAGLNIPYGTTDIHIRTHPHDSPTFAVELPRELASSLSDEREIDPATAAKSVKL